MTRTNAAWLTALISLLATAATAMHSYFEMRREAMAYQRILLDRVESPEDVEEIRVAKGKR